jgi:hypothetical protein
VKSKGQLFTLLSSEEQGEAFLMCSHVLTCSQAQAGAVPTFRPRVGLQDQLQLLITHTLDHAPSRLLSHD